VLSLLLAQAEAPSQSPLAGPGNMLFLVAIFFGIFYFMIIRPQQKTQKTHKAYLEGLKKGDEVVTNGGLSRPGSRACRATSSPWRSPTTCASACSRTR